MTTSSSAGSLVVLLDSPIDRLAHVTKIRPAESVDGKIIIGVEMLIGYGTYESENIGLLIDRKERAIGRAPGITQTAEVDLRLRQ